MNVKTSKLMNSCSLPMSRIKIIMKSSPDVDHLGPDAIFTMTKATELFVAHLANEAHKKNEKGTIEYDGLADVINSDDIFGFLQEVIPHKITVSEYWKLIGKSEEENDAEVDTSSSGE